METFHLSLLLLYPWCNLIPGSMSSSTVLFNSTLSCTRGANKTILELDCKEGPTKGLVGMMYISRIFYGTPPLTSGCNRKAPYSSCCTQNLETDCVFENNNKIDDVMKKIAGTLSADLDEAGISISPEVCNATIYPDLSSYIFVELGCTSILLLQNFTSSFIHKETGAVYLDSGYYFKNSNIKNESFQCLVETECGSNITFLAIYMERKADSLGIYPESFFFQDVKYPNVTCNVYKLDGEFISNKVMFASRSNSAMFNMTVTGNHTGKIYMKAMSTDENAIVQLSCGSEFMSSLKCVKRCPSDPESNDESTTPKLEPVFTTTTATTPTMAPNTTVFIIINPGHPINNTDFPVGTIVGIVLAVVAIILVLILICALVVRKQRKAKQEAIETDSKENYTGSPPSYSSEFGSSNDYLKSDKVVDASKNMYVLPLGETVQSNASSGYVSPYDVVSDTTYDYIDLEQENNHNDYLSI